MSRKILVTIALIIAAAALSACGFTGNLRGNPGFASFSTPSTLPEADRQLGISLGPIPLRLATMISRPILNHDEAWIPDALSDVRAVRVYIYDVEGPSRRVAAHMEAARSELIVDGWDQLVVVRDDGGLVSALVMHDEPDVVSGIVVMYEERDELVLVNVIGDIEPETFGYIMKGLDIEIPSMVIEKPRKGVAEI